MKCNSIYNRGKYLDHRFFELRITENLLDFETNHGGRFNSACLNVTSSNKLPTNKFNNLNTQFQQPGLPNGVAKKSKLGLSDFQKRIDDVRNGIVSNLTIEN